MLYMLSKLDANILKIIETLPKSVDIILYQNAIYNLDLMKLKREIYVLKEDLIARGLHYENTNLIDYKQFVALTVKHKKIISW